jgi:hypothetical protein
MKKETIIADKLQPLRMNDLEYVEMLSKHIEDVDNALMIAVQNMDNMVFSINVEDMNETAVYIVGAWKRFKKEIGFHG